MQTRGAWLFSQLSLTAKHCLSFLIHTNSWRGNDALVYLIGSSARAAQSPRGMLAGFLGGRTISTSVAATAFSERLARDLGTLHHVYAQGKLRLLVGAGASATADFPSWDALDQGILQAFIKRDLENPKAQALRLLLPLLPGITRNVYDTLRRDAVDMAWDRLKGADEDPDAFFRIVGQQLYGSRRISDLPVPTLHRQIAAMDQATIFTTNYDPLIELAMARVRKGAKEHPDDATALWRQYVGDLASADKQPLDREHVYHIHGFVEPNGEHHNHFVLTEDQYLELAHDESLNPNKILMRALTDDGALLIVGMSLNDHNLRRVLNAVKTMKVKNHRTYAILKQQPEQLVASYQDMHWREQGIHLIFVSHHDEIESILRQVKFGAYAVSSFPPWCARSLEYLANHGFPDKAFNGNWQAYADAFLRSLREQITLRFPLACGEELGLNVLIPMQDEKGKPGSPVRLSLIARIQEPVQDRSSAEERARLHSFQIGFMREEGSSGAAFVIGQADNSIDDSPYAHRNIPPGKKGRWALAIGFRDWRSILSIPIADSRDWIPICVVSITSNFGTPFWVRFGERQQRYFSELKQMVRSAVAEFLLFRH